MKKKIIASILIVVLVIVAVVAVIIIMPSSESRTLRLSVGFGLHYSQLVIAVEKGFIQKHIPSVEIELGTLFTGPEKLEAMVSNRLDFGQMGVPPAIVGITKMPVKILVSQGIALRGLYTWREDINSIEDFKEGDKINTGGFGTTQYVSLVKLFTDMGRTKEDVDKMAVSFKFADSYQLMEQREIDAEFSTGEWNWNYQDDPEYKCLLTEGDIWEMPGLVLLGKTEYVEENPDITEALLKGYIEATEFIKAYPEESLEIVAEFYGWDEPSTYEGFEFDWKYGLEGLAEISDVMYELELIEKELTLDDILFAETLEEISK